MVERCMSVMQSGTQMIKLKRGAKGLVRLFYLDEHRTRLRWRPSRKSEKAKILIDSIYKVTEGRQSEIFHRQAEGNFDPSCCFTIYHGNHMESLDLITSNPEEARTWITGLKYLMAGISDEDSLAKRQRTHDQWLKQTFEEADKNGDGLLNIEEIHQLMHKLNVNLPRRKVRQMFQEADTDENQGTLTFEEFCVFYKMMSLRRDLYLLLLSYSDKKDHLTVEELAQFLKVEQKMNNVTTDYCLDIIRKFEVSEENKAKNVLGIEGFTSFMRSPACDVFNPLHHEVFQDMEQPLCNYYIASSHNTYLTGDQLLSQSRADMYARVLQEGCRCVEVDCWDGPDGEPVVHHGYTLTSKILFRDVVETINKHAFVKNDAVGCVALPCVALRFPVILSIENHCSVQQQRKIAQYLKAIFRDKLDLSSVDTGDSKQLPSPQSLRGKILVKGKKLPYHLGDDAEEGDVSDEDSADEIEDECKFRLHCNNGTTEHQVESFIRKKLESLLKESQIRDKEDPDSFTVRALLKATHEGLNAHLTQALKDSSCGVGAAPRPGTRPGEPWWVLCPGGCPGLSTPVSSFNQLSCLEGAGGAGGGEGDRLLSTERQREGPAIPPDLRETQEQRIKTLTFTLFTQHPDVKESGKKSHGRSLMTNFGKYKQKTTKSRSKSYGTDDEEDAQQPPSKEPSPLSRLGRRRKTMKLCRELSDLVVYTNSVAAQDIMDDGSTGNVLSFSETRAHQVVQQKAEQFMVYNQKQLTRVYPSAYRIDSSNFNPLPYWSTGCQLVALNYQSEGRMMQLNRAKFKTNGNCGYVLKPQQMCKGTFNPFSGDPLPANPKKQLVLKVISGQQLPKPPDSMFGDRGEYSFSEHSPVHPFCSWETFALFPVCDDCEHGCSELGQTLPFLWIIDPFVEVEIIGLPVDCCKDQTRVVDDNGFNPMWEETLTFTVHMPEIALVRFLVWDHDPIGRDFVGQRTVTFSSLVPGYRHVYLEGLTEASIFVHITINDICGKWSPLILNPSYTILHFLGATKSRQLQGLKGLFHKNTRLAASDSNPHSMRKRSLGDRILRRTASAPAKGRKKSKTGFQEMVEIKDSVCEPAREPDGVLRRTARSLQARPVSMPVGRTLLGAWPPAPAVAEAAEGKESPPAGKDGARDGAAGMKDPRLPNFSKKLSSSSSALLPKDVGLRGSPVSTANMLVPGGQWAAPGPAGGRARSHVAGDCQEHQSPSKSLSPRQHWAPDPAPEPTRDPCAVRFKEHVDARIPAEGRSLLSQSSLEIKALGGTWDPGRAAASFSLSDISALCADAPDLHSTAILQESEISRLIDDVTLTNENEPGSSISALIGQFEETSDQASLTVVAHLHSTRVRPGRPPLPAADLEMPVKCGFPTGKPESPFLSSPPALLPSSSPETCERSARPGVCETTCTLAWKTKLDDAPPGKAKTRAVEGNLPRSSSTSHCWGPKSPAPGEALETVQARSLAPAADLTLEGVIADPTLCFNSAESSLVELDGNSENLSVTACESRREGTSHIASPLKLKYSQDAVGHFQRGLRNGYCKETLRPPVPEIFSSIQDVRNQGVSCLARQGAGSVYDHFSNSEAKTNPTCVPLSSAPDVHAPAPPWSTRAPLPAMKLPSPCKSKSLGDLTSEDIACSFESTYQCISKSFVATGAREEEGVRVPTASLGPVDALTQQLRRLVSFDQDDGCPASCSQQDTGQVPRVLVRKLSSRSQSRVRNIASRARERQEAGRPRGADPSAAGGVVLRTKRAAPAPAGTRHSTGSYVAHLHLPGAHLPGTHLPGGDGRGPPEGACACAALRSRRTHRFGSDDSFVHTEPSSDDKPEIYFLLRL
ncbi:1-phosphatidylinositol 4,5-bisphosphate phosphodiesterase eta-1 isoform X11 [Equus quagga]|uniref:1-phosphatidylinositol 4,5-bisphosphate phosphodiesterase eta-1 isoform X11 n=1 Tax=Equus quagga TaxID=89248 RepID=UPI001EE37AB8|nr:1-phosphatidylinositol 4,5-bisphosphate phosphodiesterase eta-1 isoform X11 [Equus quagga]